MTARKFAWEISYSVKARKEALKLPQKVKMQLDLLAKEIETLGPYRKNWPHYSPLKKRPGVPMNAHHCHIKGGKPTYVACWQIEDKKLQIVEIFYVGTHENSPY